MSNSISASIDLNVQFYDNEKYTAINEYFELKQIYDKQINDISKLVKNKIHNDKISYANTISNWNDEENYNYINTYTKPDLNTILQVTELEKEVSLRKEMRNNIYKEACL